jgi:hypothetical protein
MRRRVGFPIFEQEQAPPYEQMDCRDGQKSP